jgi:hypothetical protein
LPKIAKRRANAIRRYRGSATPPLESRTLLTPRRCLEEDDTRAPPPPDLKILGFHPQHEGGPRAPHRHLQEGNDVRMLRRPAQEWARVSPRHNLSASNTRNMTPPRRYPLHRHNALLAEHHAALTTVVPANTRAIGSPANQHGSHLPGPPPQLPNSSHRRIDQKMQTTMVERDPTRTTRSQLLQRPHHHDPF